MSDNILYYYGLLNPKFSNLSIKALRLKGKGQNWWKNRNQDVRKEHTNLFNRLGIDASSLSDKQLQEAINLKLGEIGKEYGSIKTDGWFGDQTLKALDLLEQNLAVHPVSTEHFSTESFAPIQLIQAPITLYNPIPLSYTFNKGETRDVMRKAGINPYAYSGSDRKALRLYLNGDSNYRKANREAIDKIFGLDANYENLKTVLKNGGSINHKEDAFIAYLANKNPGKNINTLVKDLASISSEDNSNGATNKLEEEYLNFLNTMTQSAKNGAKIAYLNKLRGGCPEGYETKYYKKGGAICSKCVKTEKAENGTKAKKNYFTSTTVALRAEDNKFKGGFEKENERRQNLANESFINQLKTDSSKIYTKVDPKKQAKNRKLASQGIELDKCGGKAKKASCGTKVACGGIKAACGKKLSKKCQYGGVLYFN